jgi:predicted metal-dependent phosphoesterase TrpH
MIIEKARLAMSASFDFHLHTCWSYDAITPVDMYFQLARECGVKHIAITEHHQMDSFAEVREAARKYPDISYIPGAELTVHSPLGTFDMVCLGLPLTPEAELQSVFEQYHQWQRDYGDAVSDCLTSAGYPYTRENRLKLLRRYRPERIIQVQGVTHVQGKVQADFLIEERRYFPDREALNALLASCVLPPYPEYSTVLPAVKRAGGLVFIAHPTYYFEQDNVARMDALREMLQFDGIECAHDIVPPELTKFYREYCLKHKLLSTAGSDCHSFEGAAYRFGADREFGRHIGQDEWRDAILERVAVLQG